MNISRAIIFLILACSLQQLHVQAQTVQHVPYYPMLNWDTSPYKSFRFTYQNNKAEGWLNFRLLYPIGYDSAANDGKKYPLTIILHGTGESARMEWKNDLKTNTPYPADDPRRDNNDHQLLYGAKEHLTAVKEGRFPGFVLFPQNFYGSWISESGDAASEMHRDLEKTLALVEYLVQNLKIDPMRISLQGISNGGVAAWYAAYKRPELFAAVLPMSAHGYPAMASTLANLKIWVFQGEEDTNPSPPATEETVQAIENAGGTIRYTLYPETGHNTWNKAYQEPDFFQWILDQSKVENPNKAPVALAGEDQKIVLPTDSVLLQGQASDEDGSIATYHWEKISGAGCSILQADALTTKVVGLEKGEYIFRFSVTDDRGAKAFDEVAVTVEDQPLAVKKRHIKEVKSIMVYPNPFTGKLLVKIASNGAREFSVIILDSLGRVVFSQMIETQSSDEHTFTLDLASQMLPEGLYLFQIQNQETFSRSTLPLLKR